MAYITYMIIKHIFIKSETEGLKHITLPETFLFSGILLLTTIIILQKKIKENKIPIAIFICTILITSSFCNLRPLQIGDDTLGYYDLALLINDKGYTYYINNYHTLRKDPLGYEEYILNILTRLNYYDAGKTQLELDTIHNTPYQGRVTLHPLLWPILISLGTMIHRAVISALIIEWIFSGLAAVSLYFLAKKIFQDSTVAAKICYLFMISPIVIIYNNLPYLDVPLSFFITTCILFYIKAYDENKKSFAIISGLFLSLAILMNFPPLILIPMLLLYTIISKKRITYYLIIILTASVLPIILTLYNYNYILNIITALASIKSYGITTLNLTTHTEIIKNIVGGFYYFITYMGIPTGIILILSLATYVTKKTKDIDHKLIFTLSSIILTVLILTKGIQTTRLLLGFYPLGLLSLGYYLKNHKINLTTGYIITSIVLTQTILYIIMNVV